MKKTALLLLVLAICSASFAQAKIQLRSEDNAKCVSSDYRQLKAVFSFSSIEAENVDTKAGEFSWLSMPNTVFGGNEGDPQIPVINELIAVPFGANPSIRVTSYSTTDYRLEDLGIQTLIPRQPSLRKDQRPEEVPFVYNEAAYQTRGLRSEPHAVVSVEGTMRGIQVGKMTIEPVSYDPVSNTLRVFNDIEVTVRFDGADARATEQMLVDTYSPYFDIVYKQLFNGRAVRDIYDQHPDLYTTPVKMLVVTTSTYANSTPFQNWLTWKKQKGINVDVQTVANNASASTIKSLIYSRYNLNHPSFLVIVGDETVVTYYSLWDYDSSYGNAATDLEYASVDGDVYHDMFISRMSVSSTTELGNLVNKILTYEKYTMADPSYLNNTILIAGWDSYWTPKIGKPTIQYANNNYFNSAHGITPYVTITTASGQTSCYNNINNAGFINYTAHGDIQEWHDPNFTNTNVNSLTNNDKYFWAMGNCCLTANFKNAQNNLTCYGEAMIRAANKGAFGYIGSVPESYWFEDFYFGVGAFAAVQGTNNPTVSGTTTGCYDAMFDDTGFNTLNSVPYIGNLAVAYAHAANYNGSVSDEYYWRAYQCFGDGSVMPYLKMPAANNVSHDVAILAGINSFRVNADAGSYVAITVNNEIIGVAAVPANATYVDVPFTTTPVAGQTAMIVVTRNQRQPYINAEVPVINNNAPQYTITANANPTAGGTVEGAGTYYENTYCTLTAVANHGYAFDNWNDNNTLNPRTITVTGNATYTANFRVLQEHQVSYTPNQSHGSISASTTSAYVGDIVTLTATPDAGYMLDYWTVTPAVGENLTVENNQFTMPDCDVTVSATFKIEPLTVYDGTATNQYIPMYGYYFDDYTKSECIIPASALTVMNGCDITSITFYPSSVGTTNNTWGNATQTVFLKEVSGTTLGGNYSGTSGATTVKQGLLEMPTAGEAYTITFDTPYTYNGGNLLIGVYNTTDGKYNQVYWYGTSNLTSGVSAYGYNGSSLNSVSYTAQSFLPKTTFTFIPLTEPYINLAPNSATVLTGFTQTLTATYGNVSGTPSITYTSSDNNVATVSGSGTTATVTAVASGTATITATMTYEGTTYTATCAITVEEPSYCEPSFSSPSDDYISNFTTTGGITNINNTSTYVTGGYSDYYSSHSASINAGETLSCTVTSSSTQWKYGHAIWVDWNKDYEFTTDERVAYTTSTATGNWTGSVAVPADANGGDYRMRVIHYYNNTPTDACMSDTYGEAEDYKLTVINGTHYTITATANPTEGGTVSGGDIFEEGESCTLTATANTGYRFTNWTMDGNVVSTDATYTFTVTASGIYVANFTAIPQYTITIAPDDVEHGTVAFGSKDEGNELYYDFEDGWQGWTAIKGDEGTSPHNWMHNTAYIAYDSNGDQIIPTCHDSSEGMMLSESYISASTSGGSDATAVYPDNYLVSPQFRLGGSFIFYAAARMSNYPAEKFSVLVSESGNTSVSDFTHSELTVTLENNEWHQYTIDLSDYSGMGYVAIRHYDCYDQHLLYVDDVTIVEPAVNDGSVSATFYEGESCTVVASPNTDYHFVNWTEDGSTVSSSATYTFTVNGDRDLVANFSQEQSVITQTTSIPAGWNWWSTPIELNGIDGWNLLQTFLGSSASMIKNQNSFSTYNNGSWTGGITSITNEEMFMLNTDEPVSFEWTGEMAQPSDHPITVTPGWNWIGFIAFDSYSLDDAFANYPALEGDMIKSQGDFAIYTNGSWNGNIVNLAPGQGLMIMSNNSASVTFYYPNGAKAVVKNEKPNLHYTYDCHQFAHTASIMASLSADEFELSEDLEVAAFVNGQCRGTTKLHHVASIDQYVAFLSVSGEDGETVEFKVYADGDEYTMAESLGFVTDQVVGSPAKPMQLHLGSRNELTFYPNPALVGETIRFEMPSNASRCQVEIFDLLGSTLRVESSTNGTIQGLGTSGVYTIKVTDENGVSHYGKLVVR